MLLIPLITIPILFIAVALLKPRIQKHLNWNLCAICIAVSVTWILMTLLWIFDVAVDPILIGVLMGMSVTGAMYKTAELYKKNKLRHLWAARLIVILGGLYTVVLLITEKWSLALLVGISSLILLIIISFLMQGVTHQDALQHAETDGLKKSVVKKLDNCC